MRAAVRPNKIVSAENRIRGAGPCIGGLIPVISNRPHIVRAAAVHAPLMPSDQFCTR